MVNSTFLLPAVVFEYVSAVLSDVLHCQREPLPLCLALLQYDKELVASEVSDSPHPSVVQLHHYYSKWLPPQCKEELVSCGFSPRNCLPAGNAYFIVPLCVIFLYLLYSFVQFKPFQNQTVELSACATFTTLMKAAYSQEPSALLKDPFRKKVEETLSCMPITEYPVAIRQVLLYMKSTLENIGTVSVNLQISFPKGRQIINRNLGVALKSLSFLFRSSPKTSASHL